MVLSTAAVVNIVASLPATTSKIDVECADGVATPVLVVVDIVGKVEGEVFGLHELPKVVGRGVLGDVGVRLSFGAKDKLGVVVGVELEVQ